MQYARRAEGMGGIKQKIKKKRRPLSVHSFQTHHVPVLDIPRPITTKQRKLVYMHASREGN